MAHILKEYDYPLPNDICLMIEEINNKRIFKLILTELETKFQYYWREKFRNYENKFFSGHLLDKFKSSEKYFTYAKHGKTDKISSYYVLYLDHFNIIKFQNKLYRDFYFNNHRILFK